MTQAQTELKKTIAADPTFAFDNDLYALNSGAFDTYVAAILDEVKNSASTGSVLKTKTPVTLSAAETAANATLDRILDSVEIPANLKAVLDSITATETFPVKLTRTGSYCVDCWDNYRGNLQIEKTDNGYVLTFQDVIGYSNESSVEDGACKSGASAEDCHSVTVTGTRRITGDKIALAIKASATSIAYLNLAVTVSGQTVTLAGKMTEYLLNAQTGEKTLVAKYDVSMPSEGGSAPSDPGSSPPPTSGCQGRDYCLMYGVPLLTGTGNIGGLAGADALCVQGKPSSTVGNVKALIVDDMNRGYCAANDCTSALDWPLKANTKYISNINSTHEVGTTNDKKVFVLPLAAGFSSDPFGGFMFMGMNADYTNSFNTCMGWTSSDNAFRGQVGWNAKTTTQAISHTSFTCDTQYLSILCVEVD